MKNKKYPIPVLLAGLPKGVAEKACKYAEKDQNFWKRAAASDSDGEFSLISSAVFYGFHWVKTKEDPLYWVEIYLFLQENEI